MIQLTISDDLLSAKLIIGNQQILFDSATIHIEPGFAPDITIDGLYAVLDKTEDDIK